MDDSERFEALFRFEFLASTTAYFAKYPAELADELAEDWMRYSADVLPESFVLKAMSVCVAGQYSARLLASLLRDCPVDFQVFESLRDLIWSGNLANYRRGLEAARTEIELLFLWLSATNKWKDRPSAEEIETHKRNRTGGEPTEDDVNACMNYIHNYRVSFPAGDLPNKTAIATGVGGSKSRMLKAAEVALQKFASSQ